MVSCSSGDASSHRLYRIERELTYFIQCTCQTISDINTIALPSDPPTSPFIMQFSRFLLGAKKLPAITSKRGNKNFYKGRGAPSTGSHTAAGGYTQDPSKIATITFVAPDLTGFKVSVETNPLGQCVDSDQLSSLFTSICPFHSCSLSRPLCYFS